MPHTRRPARAADHAAAPPGAHLRALRQRVAAIADTLEREYGRPVEARGKPLDVLVATILSQNTSDRNSDLAFSRLQQRFPTWEAVADAEVRGIEAAIRPGGLSRVKAPRIKRILRRLREERGRLSLDFLAKRDDQAARDYLLGLEGVGLKTANVVLLFALGRAAFPVDTHVLRISKRLGLIGPGVSADRAHTELEAIIAPHLRHALHLNLIAHGREVCKAGRPQCARCALHLAHLCPYPRKQGLA